jgi:hypothetical protein
MKLVSHRDDLCCIIAESIFWAIVGGLEVRRRKVSLQCAPKSVRRWCQVEIRIQL